MKNTGLCTTIQLSILLLFSLLFACSKSNGGSTGNTNAFFTFSANDSLVNYPVANAYIQDVDSLHTILLTGQYADTSSRGGNISIRIIGDTAGRYTASNLLVTFTNDSGATFTNNYDSSNYVVITKFDKSPNGNVSGTFSMKLGNAADSIQLYHGSFLAPYQN
jgi:hypothetical protein